MKFLPFTLVCFLLLGLCGCGENTAEDPRLLLAEKCREDGDFQAAERQFRRYLTAHPEAAEIHLKLASLYDESLKDPLGAAYHYREYLRLDPDSPQRETILLWIENARKKCADTMEEAADKLTDLKPELENLRKEVSALRQLALRQQQALARYRTPPAPARQTPAPAPARRTAEPAGASETAAGNYVIYEIRRGDTLGRIARHYYGNSTKIEPILQANHLTAGTVLHIGQKLKIPRLTGKK